MRDMLKMRPYVPSDRIAIRDSIDEECSDDIEDDVFIRDGKSGKVVILVSFFQKRLSQQVPQSVTIPQKHCVRHR